MKKILATILAAALGLGAWAADPVTIQDAGGNNISVYEVSPGFYQSAAVYASTTDFYITSKAGLKFFRDMVSACDGGTAITTYVQGNFYPGQSVPSIYSNNLFKNKTVHLLCDVDLENEDWTPIGYPNWGYNNGASKTQFYGSFNGHGHKVSNLKVIANQYNQNQGPNDSSKYWKNYGAYGFFGALGSNGNQVFENFTIENVTAVVGTLPPQTQGGTYIGAIAGNLGSNPATFRNCHVTGTIKLSCDNGVFVGGLFGIGTAAITDCSVEGASGSIIEGATAGGLAGTSTRTANNAAKTIEDSNVSGVTVKSEATNGRAGGLVGYASNPVSVTGNTVHDVTLSAEDGVAAALVSAGTMATDENNTTDTNVTVISDPITGSGTQADPYIIANIDALKVFRDRVNASAQNIYKGKYVRLDADIDLNNEPWTPIGNSSATPFSCIFDGNGKTISNLYINDPTMNCAGFIGHTETATITNLKVKNANLTGNDYVGAVAGRAYSVTTVQDCEVSGSIKLSGNHYVGGITGSGYAKVTGCKTIGDGAATSYIRAADVEVNAGDGDDVGGIIGLDEGGTSAIENCHVSDITVEGFRQVGGIAGLIQGGRSVVSCTVKDVVVKCIADQNTVDKKAAKMAFGGIVGAINQSGGSVTGCTVEDVQLVSDPVGVSAARMGYVSGGYYPGTEGFLIPDSLSDKITCADNTVKNVVRATEGLQEPAVASRAIDGPLFVAQVGETKYENLMEAINVAYNGGTVELLADVTVDHWHQNIWTLAEGSAEYPEGMLREPTAGPNGLTINGNGHSLTINGIDSAGNGNHIFAGSRNLTVSNITINAASGVNGIGLKSGTISDVTFNMAGSNPAIYTSGSAGCEEGEHIEIRNCTFNTSASDSYGIYSCDPENGVDSGTIISGNTFNTRRSVALRSDMQFLNNTVNGQKGVTVAGGSTAVVRGNYFADTTTSRSINVYPSNATIENNVILGPIELEDETYAVAPDLSNNYWGGDAPANLPEGVVVNSYYTTYSGYDSPAQDGSLFVLSDPVETYVAQIGETKYATLADAIAAVPTDGTETTITMIADEAVVAGVTVAAGQNIVLELNGKKISGNTDSTKQYALITNKGTLTIQDNTDTNKDGTGTGLITTYITNPDTGDVPGYASNTISNYGNLTVKSGKIVNNGSGYACFAIDNLANGSTDTILNIEGGRMEQMNAYTYAVRLMCNSTTHSNIANVSGGVITGGYGLWVQTPNNKANMAELTISGGTIDARDGAALYVGGTKADNSNISIEITDGTIGGTGVIIQGPLSGTYGNVEISGGDIYNVQCGANVEKFISGGIYHEKPNEAYMADGYAGGANTDGETNVAYPTAVGLLKVTDIVQQAGATETRATYAVTVVVVNDKGETIGTLPDLLTIEVSIAAADVAGSTLAKYDVSKVLDAALASGGLNVTKVEISVVISAPTSGEGTVSYEVHPEAVVTVTKDSTNTTTTIPLSNACLAADASFTFDLDVTGVVEAKGWAKVTHVSADPNYAAEARNLKAFAGDGGKVYVTVTTTHFSTFTVEVGVLPVTFGVRSDNLFGSIKIAENVASNLYVAVPFEGFEADGALRKAQDVVHAANLTAGTKMYVYDKNADKYDVFEVDANGKWTAALKINVTEMTNTFDTADLTRGVTNGTGVIVGRKNTAETVYVYGQVPKIPIASTTFGAGQTLVSPPYTNGVEYVDLNASTWTGVSATTKKRLKGQAGADYIQFRAPNNKLVKYYYLEGEGWGVVPTQVSQFPEFVANGKALIPVGTAFWYYSTSGGAKVEWK